MLQLLPLDIHSAQKAVEVFEQRGTTWETHGSILRGNTDNDHYGTALLSKANWFFLQIKIMEVSLFMNGITKSGKTRVIFSGQHQKEISLGRQLNLIVIHL